MNRDSWYGENSHIRNYIHNIRKIESVEIGRPHYQEHLELFKSFQKKYTDLFTTLTNNNKINLTIKNGCVCIDVESKYVKINIVNLLTDLKSILTLLIPWRKGPFSFFPSLTQNMDDKKIFIDAEWQSYKKWDRLTDIYSIKSLCNNKKILDIGCNNMYYSFRMLSEGANSVVGFDPIPKNFWYYKIFSFLLQKLPFYYELCGAPLHETLRRELQNSFDTVFCMGILYHQRNPLLCLESLSDVLKPGGHLVVESLCISSKEDICLFPQKTYQNSRGYWFIPSVSAIQHWCTRTGFEIVVQSDACVTTDSEQRQTTWAPTHSLNQFLHPKNRKLTVENYEAPHRCIVVVRKK